MNTIINSIVKIIGENLYEHLNGHENLRFQNELDIQTSSKHSEESGYGLSLDLLTFSSQLHDSYSRRMG